MTSGVRRPGPGGEHMTSGTSGVWIMLAHYFVSRYTVNLYNGRRSSSADPVAAFRGLVGAGLDHGLEPPAAGLDDHPGSRVVLVADHQDPADAVRPGDHEALPEYLGGVAAPPVPGKNGVADVAAFPGEDFVEGETDGRPADYLSPDIGDQKRRGNPPGGSARYGGAGVHPVPANGSHDTHAHTPKAGCDSATFAADEALGVRVADGSALAGFPASAGLLRHFLKERGRRRRPLVPRHHHGNRPFQPAGLTAEVAAKVEHGDRPITIITGGTRGIGAATAVQLAQAGHDLTLAYRQDDSAAQETAAQVQAAGARCVLAKADITRQDDIERLFSITASQLGMVTGLVNNAGATAHVGDLADTPVEVVRRVIDVNFLGVILCARQASKVMSVRRGGHGGAIVNISSAAATLGSPHEYVHYAAAKAAVEALTVGLAKELAADQIRVNAVAPGTIRTAIHAAAGDPGRPDRVARNIPLGRAGEPGEIAPAIAWLLGPEASYVTGAVLRVAGGL